MSGTQGVCASLSEGGVSVWEHLCESVSVCVRVCVSVYLCESAPLQLGGAQAL